MFYEKRLWQRESKYKAMENNFSIVPTHSIYRTIEEEKHPNCHFTTNTWTKKYNLHVPHAFIHFMGKHIFLLSKMGGNPFSFSEMGYGNPNLHKGICNIVKIQTNDKFNLRLEVDCDNSKNKNIHTKSTRRELTRGLKFRPRILAHQITIWTKV